MSTPELKIIFLVYVWNKVLYVVFCFPSDIPNLFSFT